MAPSLYELSVPVYIRSLKALIHCLEKGETWATENNVPVDDLVEKRIVSDMLPLKFQIQSASNTSKAVLSRLAGQENPSIEDNETTYKQLIERVQKTIDALNTAKPENFEGKEDCEVSMFNGKYNFTGLSYLQSFGLPNFYFHIATAYNILRMQGVPVGKLDYLGSS